MYIAMAMSTDPVCLHPEMTLLQARDLAAGKSIRHFPVTDAAGRLVGMVSDRDLRSALPSTVLNPTVRVDQLERLARVRVDAIMSRPPIALPREATLDDALLLFDRHRIGALGVVDHDGLLLGVITVRDVLAAFRRLFGIGAPGSSLIEVRDDGRPQLLTRIVRALEEAGTTCTRLVRKEDGDGAVVYARVLTYNLHGVREVLRAAGLETVSRKPGEGAAP
ncbi:MAG TPA: CBS domain-containing protein [bacterium]